jgi:hypothetical protein
MCGYEAPLRPRRNPNQKAIRPAPPEKKERLGSGNAKRPGNPRRWIRIYIRFEILE